MKFFVARTIAYAHHAYHAIDEKQLVAIATLSAQINIQERQPEKPASEEIETSSSVLLKHQIA
jgi:hypothetical protein